jgi:flagellar L-ring protein precursor FlgH
MKKQFIGIATLITLGFGQNSLYTSKSMFTDIKAHDIGDVITVLIAEMSNASRESSAKISANSGLGADGSVSGNLSSFIPLLGMSTNISENHNDDEGSSQTETVTGKITATIIEKNSNGLLKIEGKRKVNVNGETNIMEISGFVRDRDITSQNTVYSYYIADADIIYKKTGLINKVSNITKIRKAILGVVTVAILVDQIGRYISNGKLSD